MRFAEPWLLWGLLAIPLLAAGFALSSWRAGKRLERFAGGEANRPRFDGEVGPHRRALKALLVLLAAASGVVAAARPQWGTGVDAVTRRGVDVAIAVDTSRSMAARDVPPDRLGLAKHAAGTLVDALSGDRIAVVTFAGGAAIACPLTLDHEAVRLFLDSLDEEAVSVQGTALADAVDSAIRALPKAEGAARDRAIVVLSDGEDHEGGLERAIEAAKAAGAKIWTVGVGTPDGSPIPEGDESGEWKKDRDGRVVTTRLVATSLARLASETGGRYYTATPSEVEIGEIAKAIGALEAGEAGTVLRTRYTERFQIPLAVAIVALLVEAAIADRRRRKEERA